MQESESERVEKKSSIGQRIKAIREDKGLSQVEFARAIGTQQPNVSDYETKGVVPRRGTIRNIVERYSVNEKWLLTGEGDRYLPTAENGPEYRNPATEAGATASEPTAPYSFHTLITRLPEDQKRFYIPYYDIDVAGRIEAITAGDASAKGYIYAPGFANCFACRVDGDSMYDMIYPGATVFIQEISPVTSFDPDRIYLIILDYHKVLKSVHVVPEDQTRVVLRSVNRKYEDWTIPLGEIRKLFLVKGYWNQIVN
ncbi:XRE family transcriptional regulator [Larkinella soli]|uniref:XRE family transcriptional regulator n=1 Tax=Larkinella soli TaxID=1770527 RepID=UPI000FFC4C01|nr:LexA family transcriptional regulator [Larkinella soli]